MGTLPEAPAPRRERQQVMGWKQAISEADPAAHRIARMIFLVGAAGSFGEQFATAAA